MTIVVPLEIVYDPSAARFDELHLHLIGDVELGRFHAQGIYVDRSLPIITMEMGTLLKFQDRLYERPSVGKEVVYPLMLRLNMIFEHSSFPG